MTTINSIQTLSLDHNFDGILFVGDPHFSGKNIGRRKDNYTESVLSKLNEIASIANENNYITLFLGDFLHKNNENNIEAINKALRVLSLFKHVPWVLEGNHDKELNYLSDKDTLTTFILAGKLKLLDHTTALQLLVKNKSVFCHCLPYGSYIPDIVDRHDSDVCFAMTHHDMAFENPYPGSIALKEVLNCDFIVNGHMHGTKKSEKLGLTWWHNPGNIEPLSIDLMHHIPRVWAWENPSQNSALKPIDLPHKTDIFDLTGISVAAGDSAQAVEELIEEKSAFADALKGQSSLEADKTEDASVLVQDVQDVLEAAKASDDTKKLFEILLQRLTKGT